jgi:nicotinamide-nucleotide amidase
MPVCAELLSVGSELLRGATVNTNAAFLGGQLEALGVVCVRQTTVGDERAALAAALQDALGRCQLLITTGGLGPTFDDLTVEVLADVAGRKLRCHLPTETAIRRFYSRRHRRLQQAALRQALIPEGALALPNLLGTAPGLWLALPSTVIIALPGVPSEMRAIFERSVRPRLQRLPGREAMISCTLRTAGLVELAIEQHLKTLRVPAGVEIGLYPHLRTVDVCLTSRRRTPRHAAHALAPLARRLRRLLGEHVYSEKGELIEAVIGRLLRRQRATVAVAESCTGGLVSDRLTNVAGSSDYFQGSVIAYHNGVKTAQLAVPAALLRRHGAVSAQVASAMAEGVRRALHASIGLAITGIAGPSGGTAAKPVGRIYLALSNGQQCVVQRGQFFGDRLSIKAQAAQTALDLLRRFLLKR